MLFISQKEASILGILMVCLAGFTSLLLESALTRSGIKPSECMLVTLTATLFMAWLIVIALEALTP